MICRLCFSMLRGQAGRQWRGSHDLVFNHQPTLSSLKQSADMACSLCRRVYEDLPADYDPPKLSPRENRALVSAYISAIQTAQGLYRLDFTLSGPWDAKQWIGTLLLRQTDNNSETRQYVPQSRNLNSQEVLNLARSWIEKCIGPDHKHCPDGDFRNRVNLRSNQINQSIQSSSANLNGSGSGIQPLSRATTFIERKPPFYPTRLIDLKATVADANGEERYEPGIVKLVVTRNSGHRKDGNLLEPDRHYVTLSHCWGKTKQPFCLKASNLDVFRTSGIPLKELPKTFRDVIDFARRLSPSNVKYIWIDSLCIIQGDSEDWLHESTQMYQIYRNSYCNISATAAKDSSRGLYAERQPEYLWAEDVSLNAEDLLRVEVGFKRKRETPGLESLIQRCSLVDPSLWDRKVEAAPVNTRAWVLQERLLAPRVLHFCEDQIAWECRELDASENASTGIEGLEVKNGRIQDRVRLKSLVASEYGPRNSFDKVDIAYQAHENWKRIVERYSLTSLTKANDKLIALAGIAEQMSAQIGVRVAYVAGMWKNKYFASQLLWRVDPVYKSGKFLYPSRRPKAYCAPTFSWAAIDAPQGIRCGETAEEGNLLFEVSKVDVQANPNSNFGLVKEGGYIRIKCQKDRIQIRKKKRRTEDGDQEDMYAWDYEGDDDDEEYKKMHPNVYLDSPEDDYEEIRGTHNSMWLVPAYKNPEGDLISLLLQQDKEVNKQYRRVGLSVTPRYVSADESSECRKEKIHGVKKGWIQIV
ncbi:heterokaryon incompatibility protein-domain-containing protein [Leptodontidium sp. MPI-SDFR-AT-0119]|nr:heterokaryon incompatibility protein-domain-containing protein [Leptodontidium sp. MPI-SDFR-AT-0119]